MRFAPITALILTSFLLTSCGSSDDVEISLPFVGDIMAKAKTKEEKMVTRGSLVLPPKVVDLPEPEAKKAVTDQAWPNDPDMLAKKDAEVAAIKQKQFQKDGDWKGERNSGNGLEDFKDKIDWSRRQPGIFKKLKKNVTE